VNTRGFLDRYKEGERDFAGANLSEMHLGNEDLSNINLTRSDLRKVNLCETKLENANLQNADLRDADLSCDGHGRNINFTGANFRKTGLYEGIIEMANFSNADFRDASFSQYIMTNCNFSGANFSNAWISETDFHGADLTGATFCRAHIDINFEDANIANVDFSNAVFFCSPKQMLETRGVVVSDANFTNAIFFVRRILNSNDLDISAIQGAICVSSKSDLDNLNLDEYNSFAVENMMEHFNQNNNPSSTS
jgi:uncharacterized protein YjbI with pentapeptide repeats